MTFSRKRNIVAESKYNVTLEPDEEILALRKKLEEARQRRKASSI